MVPTNTALFLRSLFTTLQEKQILARAIGIHAFFRDN